MGIQGHETSDPSVSYIKTDVALRGGRNLCVRAFQSERHSSLNSGHDAPVAASFPVVPSGSGAWPRHFRDHSSITSLSSLCCVTAARHAARSLSAQCRVQNSSFGQWIVHLPQCHSWTFLSSTRRMCDSCIPTTSG